MSFYSVLVYVKDEPTRQFILEEHTKSEVKEWAMPAMPSRCSNPIGSNDLQHAFGLWPQPCVTPGHHGDLLRTILRQHVTYIDNKSISNQRNQETCLLMLVDIG